MALVTPLLLTLMFGSVELGNYFYNEHILIKAVRDGARFAGRQGFSNYDCSGPANPSVVTNTQNIVMTGVLSGGTNRLRNWNASTVTLTYRCTTTAGAGGPVLKGIYSGATNGAPVVTVAASVPYVPILASFGFRGTGLSLNASQQSLVMGR